MVAGVCMVLSPLLLLVAVIVHPAETGEARTQLATVAANLDTWYLAHVLVLAALVLAIPVVLGFMHMLREREVAFGHIGGALGLIGIVAWAGLVAMEFVVWQMAQVGGGSAQMAALLERITAS